MRASLALGLVTLIPRATCWGISGHRIIASIAQVHLLPSARKTICKILSQDEKCNLAAISTWADDIRKESAFKSYKDRHFVNPKGDNPPTECVFGRDGWRRENHILNGIVDESRKIITVDNPEINRDHALRFLVHFVGDVHQPFHLTEKDHAGNNVKVFWKETETDLHAVWDYSIIDHQVEALSTGEYTRALPTRPSEHTPSGEANRNRHIEAVLEGSDYGPYIRSILSKIYGLWARDAKNWILCPQSSKDRDHDKMGSGSTSGGTSASAPASTSDAFHDPADLSNVCPFYWAAETHPLLCTSIWPQGFNSRSARQKLPDGYVDLSAPIIEKLLAKAGIRLASVLNGLLGSAEDRAQHGLVPMLK